ncbi:outer membrane beta-barrel protein [Ulvibacterium sp.]|uniref:outer membrane beta-barrel protein n=1 Tax=Ulvibacterium sp. TaxID=2665914 RepID=UPI003BA85602
MKDSIDDKIVEQIKGVFDHWEEPYNPEDLEKLLKKKKKNRKVILWLPFRYAAVVLVLFTTAVLVHNFLKNEGENEFDLPIEQNTEEVHKEKNIEKDQFEKGSRPEQKIDILQNTEATVSRERDENGVLTEKEISNNGKGPIKKGVTVESNTSENPSGIKSDPSGEKSLFSKEADSTAWVEGTLPKTDLDNKKIIAETNEREKMARVEEEAAKELLEGKLDEETLDEVLQSKIRFGVVLSPMVNYNQGTGQSNVTFSGGAALEVPVLKNIDFYTGLSLINQRIHFEENALFNRGEGTQLKSRQVILTGLELPLNLKYNFRIGEKQWFATAGVSSTTYFQEEVESTFQDTRIVFDEGLNGVTEARTQESLRTERENAQSESGSFNFAGILNLSIGIELPINNKKQSLIVEPFINSSLSPVTRENVDFTNGGVKLRLNFNSF